MPRRSFAGWQTDKTWPNRVNRGLRRRGSRSACAGTLDLGFFHRWGDRPDNALSHLVLQIEDVAETTIKPVCPKMCPGGGIHELSGDAHPVCRLANAAFQHVAHPKLAPDLLHIYGAPLV